MHASKGRGAARGRGERCVAVAVVVAVAGASKRQAAYETRTRSKDSATFFYLPSLSYDVGMKSQRTPTGVHASPRINVQTLGIEQKKRVVDPSANHDQSNRIRLRSSVLAQRSEAGESETGLVVCKRETRNAKRGRRDREPITKATRCETWRSPRPRLQQTRAPASVYMLDRNLEREIA